MTVKILLFRSMYWIPALYIVLSACQVSPLPEAPSAELPSAEAPRPASSSTEISNRVVSPSPSSAIHNHMTYLPYLRALRDAVDGGNMPLFREYYDALSLLTEEHNGTFDDVLALQFNAKERQQIVRLYAAKEVEQESAQRDSIGANILKEYEPLAIDILQTSPYYDIIRNDDWLVSELKVLLIEFGENRDIRIPNDFRDRVRHYIYRYVSPGQLRRWYQHAILRQSKYRPLIEKILKKYQLPSVVLYLALVESGFDPYARSSAGAVGLWQFIPSTGKHYGLNIGRPYDERTDPEKSTSAAAEYLQDLILEFGSGHSTLLAMAAYNAGEGRIRTQLRKLEHYKDRSFWGLARIGLLPKETQEYIPRIMAAAIVGKSMDMFDIKLGTQLAATKNIMLYRSVPLADIIKKGDMDYSTLYQLNPELSSQHKTTPGNAIFMLTMPQASAEKLEQSDIIQQAMHSQHRYNEPRENVLVYTVQRGNRWRQISSWSGVSVKKIKADNRKIHGKGLRYDRPLYLYGVRPGLHHYQHHVRKGDTLSEIAELYRTRLSWLRSWNGLRDSRIILGSVLHIYVNEAKIRRVQMTESAQIYRAQGTIEYKIKSGDNIWSIARAFGHTAQSLKKINNLKSDTIQAGQKLFVNLNGLKKRVIRVRAGDTLSEIALKYRVSLRELKIANHLRFDNIRIGETLVLYTR